MWLFPHGGYENPGYGAWGVAVTIQSTIALCMLLLAGGDHDEPGSSLQLSPEGGPYRIKYVNAAFFNFLGTLHVVGACVTTVVVLIGYLGVSVVLSLLPFITLMNSCLLLCTAGLCGYIVTKAQNMQQTLLDHTRHPEMGPDRVYDYSEIWAHHNERTLMYISCVSVAEVVCFSEALLYRKDATTGTRATAWFSTSLLMVFSAMVVFLMTALPKYSAIGIVWLVGWALLALALLLQQCCWYRRLAAVIAVIFVLSFAYSLIICIVTAATFTITKKYTFKWTSIDKEDVLLRLTDSEYSWLKATRCSNSGQYFMWECLACTALCVFTFFSMLYAFYSLCTKKTPAARKAKSANVEEIQKDEEKVELKQETPVGGPTDEQA